MPVNTGSPAERTQNCAMCTMAGILGTTSTNIQARLGATGQSDTALGIAWGINHLLAEPLFTRATDLVWRFIFVELKKQALGNYAFAYRSGTVYADLKDHATIVAWMGGFPDTTHFAVWGSEEMPGYGAHWNAAFKANGHVTFHDWQQNHGVNPAMVQPHFNAPANAEPGHHYIKFLALAFSKWKVPGR